MRRNILEAGLLFLTICSLGACGGAGQRTEISGASGSTGSGAESREGSSYGSGGSEAESYEGSGYGSTGSGAESREGSSYGSGGSEAESYEGSGSGSGGSGAESREGSSYGSGGSEGDDYGSSSDGSIGYEEAGREGDSYESAEGTQIKMITDNTEVVITLNDSRAAAELAAMLPLELTLIERNRFAKGMTIPEHLPAVEQTTREYEIGDFGYWDAGPDLAIFYDDIYEQTIVEVIPLGHAETGAETMAGETGTVRLELIEEEGDRKENE